MEKTNIGQFRPVEFQYIKDFIRESCFDEEISCDWLRMLWTSYCLHYGYVPDTSTYDGDVLELWSVLEETKDGTSEWADFDEFDNFMCKYLV